MTTTLPSFVELMASLGLDNPSGPPALSRNVGPSCSARVPHSRSSSTSSSSSLSSVFSNTMSPSTPSIQLDGSPATLMKSLALNDGEWDLDRRPVRSARYSPYGTPISHISHMRKRSVPNMLKEEGNDTPHRALSTSPYLSSASGRARRTQSVALTGSKRPQKLLLSEGDCTANTPISSFVRRKTPQASPTSPTFPHHRRGRSNSPAMPVSIPTLPPVFASLQAQTFPPSDTEDEDMHDLTLDLANQLRSRRQRRFLGADPARLSRASDPVMRLSAVSAVDATANYTRHVSSLV